MAVLRAFVLIVSCSYASIVLASSYPITMLRLHFQTAETILPVIKPMLGKDSSVSGNKDIILLRASPKVVREIRAAIRRLDTIPRTLVIKVMYADRPREISHQRLLRDIKVYQSDGVDKEDSVQTIRVLDGRTATISSGKIVPALVGLAADFRFFEAQYDWDERNTTFTITPTLHGRTVSLEIGAERNATDRFGQIDKHTRRVITSVAVPLGQWQLIGSSDNGLAERPGTTVYETGDRELRRSHLYIRVDLLKTQHFR